VGGVDGPCCPAGCPDCAEGCGPVCGEGWALNPPLDVVGIAAWVGIVLWVGAQDVLSDRITPGRLGQFVLYAVFASGALGSLSEIGGEIAGFCVTAHQDDRGYIVTIDVLPQFRREHVGTKLLDEIERRLGANGVREVALETATDNDSAVAFWTKHGYRNRGIKKDYYPGGRDAFAMSKTLPL